MREHYQHAWVYTRLCDLMWYGVVECPLETSPAPFQCCGVLWRAVACCGVLRRAKLTRINADSGFKKKIQNFHLDSRTFSGGSEVFLVEGSSREAKSSRSWVLGWRVGLRPSGQVPAYVGAGAFVGSREDFRP